MRLAAATTGPGPGRMWRDACPRKFLRTRLPGWTPPPGPRRPPLAGLQDRDRLRPRPERVRERPPLGAPLPCVHCQRPIHSDVSGNTCLLLRKGD